MHDILLVLAILLCVYLVIRDIQEHEGFSAECSGKNLKDFYDKTYKEFHKGKPLSEDEVKKLDKKLEEKLSKCRNRDDIDTFKAWARSGIGRMEISDYHDLKPNNRKCIYGIGVHGGEYEEIDREDLDNYYDAPISKDTAIDATHKNDPQKLRKMLDIYNQRLKAKDSSGYTKNLNDFFTKSDTPGKVTQKDYDSIREWLKTQKTDEQLKLGRIDKAYHRCDTPYALHKDSWRVNRPDIRLDGKLKHQNSKIPIPCSKPLLPWLEDPGDEDEHNRTYCKPQTTPCEKCGAFSDTPIYGYMGDEPIDGPNVTPQDVETNSMRDEELYGQDGFMKDIFMFGKKDSKKP